MIVEQESAENKSPNWKTQVFPWTRWEALLTIAAYEAGVSPTLLDRLNASPSGRPFLYTVMRDYVYDNGLPEVSLLVIDAMAERWERPPEEWELEREVGRGGGVIVFSSHLMANIHDENLYSVLHIGSAPGMGEIDFRASLSGASSTFQRQFQERAFRQPTPRLDGRRKKK